MSNVPTNLIPSTLTQLPEYQGSSTLGYFAYSLEGRSYKVQFANLASVGAVPSTRVIAAGTGLTGGGDLSQDRVISIANGGVGTAQLANSGVVAGTYGSGSAVPVLTVDAKGRVTTVSTAPLSITGYVPDSRTITTGAGLLGGGSLASNLTITVDFYSSAPQALGSASAGVSNAAARGDHVHPAVDLSDNTQTQGALPLGRGGTGDALSPVAGAVVYSTGTKFALADPGIPGQVFTSDGAGEPYWQTVSGTGTVTDVSVVTANGFAGAVTNPGTTPAITISTTVTGLLKGNGTAVSAAIAGVDYASPGANSDITSLSGITGGISMVDSITFDTAAAVTAGQGQIAWNAADGTLDIGMGYDGVMQQVGLEQYYRIKATATITDGQCVMFTGSVGASGVLTGAPSTGVTNGQYIMGVATMDIANNGFGYVTSFGLVRDIDTTGSSVGETWADGDILYYNPAYVGGLTKVLPLDNQKIVVAVVVNAGPGGSGSLFVRVQAEPKLQALSDVYAPSPISNGQILIGDGPQSRWEAATLTAGTNVSITNAAGAITINSTDQYVGTVTSVAASGGTTGLTFSGSPITTSGTLTLGGTLGVANGGTGATTLSSGYLVKGNGTSAVSASVVYDNGSSVSIGSTSSGSSKFYVYDANASISTNEVAAAGTGVASSRWKYSTNHYGIYVGSVNAMVFYDYGASAERMRIDSSGNVGIGTSAPAARVHIVNSTLNAQLRLQDVTTDATTKYGVVGTGHYTNAQSPILAVGVGSLSASSTLYFGGGFGTLNAATAIQFYTAANNTTLGGSERMRIDSSGNVGIGTSAPVDKLQVEGNLYFGTSNRVVYSGGSANLTLQTGTGVLAFNTGGSVERMRIDSSGQVGIGGAAATGTTLRIGKSLTGAVNSFGTYNNQAIQSDVTTTASLFATYPSTAASAFTLSNLYHFSAAQGPIGATSAVTSQVGFFAQAGLVGATYNYGFYGALASGTGRYNLYMAGTADNYLAGNVGIGTSSPSTKLDVSGVVKATAFTGIDGGTF